MNNLYLVRIVSHLDKEEPIPTPPKGGFGLTEDDIIYKTVRTNMTRKDETDPVDTDDPDTNPI